MERVTFVIEATQERIPALLNPEDLVIRRTAGVRPLRSASGPLTGAQLADDPLLFTGGGRTELEMALLFDVGLPDSPAGSSDVRDMTRPLWDLAENQSQLNSAYGLPQLARMVWGKAWNFLGAVTAIAERLEQFDVDGTPSRSWLRLRMVRCGEAPASAEPLDMALFGSAPAQAEIPGPSDDDSEYQAIGGGTGDDGAPVNQRLDVVADEVYGAPWMWRLIAGANALDSAPWAAAGTVLRIPPMPGGSAAS
ncbi:MAG TPA: hypothetical protein VEJ84_02550 [Acidimicrobiales bacterium]|nr:hypothetical protein [Acidimicrobiales bacterium]